MTHRAPDAQVPGSGGPLLDVLRELDEAREEADAVAGGLSRRQLWWRPEEGRWSVGECLDHLVRAGEAYLEVVDEAVEDAWEKRLLGEPPYRRTLVGRWVVRALEPPPGLKLPAPGMIRPRRPAGVGRAPDAAGGAGPATGGAASAPGGAASAAGGAGSGTEDAGSAAGGIGPRTEDAASAPGGAGPTGGGGDGGSASPYDDSPLPRFMALRGRLAQRLGDAKGLDFGKVKVRSPFVPLLRVDLLSAFLLVAAHERRHLWQAQQVTKQEGFPRG